jgi:hypothetical protein
MKNILKTPSLAVLIGLIITGSGHAQSFLSNGLVAYYPFDGNASDASGKNNNGVAYNVSYGTNRFSIPSKSAYFNASLSSYVNLPNIATNLSGLSKATFSFWMKTTNNQQNSCIFADWNNSSGGIFICFNGQTASWLINTCNYVDHGGILMANAPQLNAWHHYCIIFDGTQLPATNIVSYYVDGVVVNKMTDPSYVGMNTIIGTNTTSTLGNRQSQYYFTGWLDDFRIYNRALSSNEVAQLFAVESQQGISLIKAVALQDYGLTVGSNYQVQVSSDLINWTNQGSVFRAASPYWQSTNYWQVANWNQLFFRLESQ